MSCAWYCKGYVLYWCCGRIHGKVIRGDSLVNFLPSGLMLSASAWWEFLLRSRVLRCVALVLFHVLVSSLVGFRADNAFVLVDVLDVFRD